MKYKFNKLSNDVIENIYLNRELTDNIVDEILNADEKFWEDTHNYLNIDKAYNRLMDSIENNENIGILVDNDTDGFCSAAILFQFIYYDLKYENVWYIIHTKDVKAHGVTKEIIEYVKNKDIKLLITPDAGSNDKKEHIELWNMGTKFIALDHHEFDLNDTFEHAVIVSNQDENVNNVDGSGTLVTYKFIDYVCEELDIELGFKYMDLVNIANIADMRDMVNLENRYFYNVGKCVKNMTNKLLLAFTDDLKRNKYITIENVQFGISNMINSIIRNGTYKEREDLFEALLGSDEIVEYKYKGNIISQSLQKAVIRYAKRLKRNQKEKIVDDDDIETFTTINDKVMIVKGDNIPKEVRGLMANQLSKKYCRPILILKKTKKGMEGSARGYIVNNFKGLCEESKLFDKLEGHPGAFGSCISEDNISKFIEFANNKLKDMEFDNIIEIDFEYESHIPIADIIDVGALHELWSNEIRKPLFLIKNIIVNTKDINKNKNSAHFKIDKVQFRKDYMSKVFYEDMIKLEENKDKNMDLKMDILFDIKQWESGLSYANIIEIESKVVDIQTPLV